MNTHVFSRETLGDYLRKRIAVTLSVEPYEIEGDELLARYGMDSMSAVALIGELEEAFNTQLPNTLIWDNPSLNMLIQYFFEKGIVKAVNSTTFSA